MSFEARLVGNYMKCVGEMRILQNLQGLSTLFDFYLIGMSPFQLVQNLRPDYWDVAYVQKHDTRFNHNVLPGLSDRPVYGQHFFKEDGVTVRFQSGQSMWNRWGDGREFTSKRLARMGNFNVNCVTLRMNADIVVGKYTEIDYPLYYTSSFVRALEEKVLDLSPIARQRDMSDRMKEWIRKTYTDFLRDHKRWTLSEELADL